MLFVSKESCAARIAALDEARRVLGGKEHFDKFLYLAVAPKVQASESTEHNPDRAEQLRYQARGCQ